MLGGRPEGRRLTSLAGILNRSRARPDGPAPLQMMAKQGAGAIQLSKPASYADMAKAMGGGGAPPPKPKPPLLSPAPATQVGSEFACSVDVQFGMKHLSSAAATEDSAFNITQARRDGMDPNTVIKLDEDGLLNKVRRSPLGDWLPPNGGSRTAALTLDHWVIYRAVASANRPPVSGAVNLTADFDESGLQKKMNVNHLG